MPYKPKVPCKHPGCAELVEPGKNFCEKHKSLHPEYIRSANSRGYSRRWQNARKKFLAENPLCVMCLKEGKYTAAEVVDHITPHRGDAKKFWDVNNWQGLCKKHHDLKTGYEDSKPQYKF